MSTKSIVFWLLLVSYVVLAHCQTGEDICLLPEDTGMCRADFPMWFYNPSSGKCESFVYGGCGGNDNRFETEADCIHRCVCSRPAYTGPCKAYIPSYYYDKSTSSCKQFIYGGCQSNGNNFGTQDECLKTCG